MLRVKIIGGYKKTKDNLEFTASKHFSLQSEQPSPSKDEERPALEVQTTDSLQVRDEDL